jgi:hypothetical protein
MHWHIHHGGSGQFQDYIEAGKRMGTRQALHFRMASMSTCSRDF